MRKYVVFAAAGILALVGFGVAEQKNQIEPNNKARASLQVTQCALKVNGMVCGGCAGMAKQALLKMEGVTDAEVNYKSGEAHVDYDSKKTTPDRIVTAFNQANRGFRAELAKTKAK